MASVIRGSDNFDSGDVIGQNQTWQDVTLIRSAGITYTNTTGKPIFVLGKFNYGSGGSGWITVDGVRLDAGYETAYNKSVATIVPNGSTYSYNSDGGCSLDYARELR